MRLMKHFTSFSMFGVKFVSESSRKFFNFESVRRDLVLLLINFMDENAYLHVGRSKTYNSVPWPRVTFPLQTKHQAPRIER